MNNHFAKLLLNLFAICLMTSVAYSQDITKEKSNDSEPYRVTEEMPRFPGCEGITDDPMERDRCSKEKLLKFVYQNLKYPKVARVNGVEGMAVVQFVVTDEGAIDSIKVVRDPGGGCGQAAAELMESMNDLKERWQPGIQDGVPVKVMYTLPIKFALKGPKRKKRRK